MITPVEMAEKMKAEIIADVKAGIVPVTVANFAELHDHVDANCYGGADELFGEIVTESKTDAEHQAKLDTLSAIMDPAIDIVNAWIEDHGIARSLAPKQTGPVKVTVYRPRELIGLGAPEAFLGDDQPTKG